MDKAINYFEECNSIMNKLYEANPQSESRKRGLANLYEILGSIHQAMGSIEKAIECYENHIRLFQELNESHPFNEESKKHLAIYSLKLGELYWENGQKEKALNYFENSSIVYFSLLEANPENISYKYDLAHSYSVIGDIYQLLDNIELNSMEKAIHYYEMLLGLLLEIPQNESDTIMAKSKLAWKYENLGSAYYTMGKLNVAKDYFERSLILTEIVELHPDNIEMIEFISFLNYKLAIINKTLGDHPKGLEYYSEWKKLITYLLSRAPNHFTYQLWNQLEY
jgi:tetratricopeptide (TPR) repeat protein